MYVTTSVYRLISSANSTFWWAQQGQIYDSPGSVHSIPSFIETYSIRTDELLQPDISKYGCFNEFFFR